MISTLYDKFKHWSEKGSVYIYSDPHFQDNDMLLLRKPNVIDDEQLQRINKTISKNDTLILLGDIGDETYLAKIRRCYKVLILGNHDKGKQRYQEYVDEIYEGPLFISDKLLLSHEPINLEFAYNIHGHDHSNYYDNALNAERHLNVCAEYIDFTPVRLNDIVTSGVLKRIDNIHRIAIDNASSKSNNSKTNRRGEI